MTIFWILTAGLMGLALLFVVTPLLSRRQAEAEANLDALNLSVIREQLAELDADLDAGNLDQAQYDAARRDLERELLYDLRGGAESNDGPVLPARPAGGGRWLALALALAVPAAAVSLYLSLGSSSIISRLEMAATGAQALPAGHPAAPSGEMPPLDVLVQRLADKMQENPDNLEGWMMLGRTYFALRRPDQALAALENAYRLAPREPEVLVAYAEAVAANKDGQLAGRPTELIRTALEIDPDNASARWLEGLVHYQRDDFAGAVQRWEGLLAGLDPQSEEAAELRAFIADARERGGLAEAPAAPALAQAQTRPQTEAAASAEPEPAPAATPATPPAEVMATGGEPIPAAPAPTGSAGVGDDAAAEQPAEDGGAEVTVSVSLAEALRGRAQAGDTLFVYAKAAAGPPMPLAVKRLQVSDLPVTVTLDDSMAMMPAMRLSAFPQVTVGARVSRSGRANPASGDLEGEVTPVEPGRAAPVPVVIDRVRP